MVGQKAIRTQRLTAAAEQNLQRSGMTLTRVRVRTGATPGCLGIRYGQAGQVARFPVGSNGTQGTRTYKVNWKIEGSVIPADVFTFTGGLALAELFFESDPEGGLPSIETYRGLAFFRTDAGAVTADITENFIGGDNTPKGIMGFISASTGRATFASHDQATESIDGHITDGGGEILPCPGVGAASSLTLSVLTAAAASSLYVVYY